jgi:hypothetical protein
MPSSTCVTKSAQTTQKYFAVARIDGVMTACPSRSEVAMPSSGRMSPRQTSNCLA